MATIQVGDEEIVVGRVSPEQVAGLTNIIGRYFRGASESLSGLDDVDNIALISALLMAVDGNALVELGQLVSGKDEEWVRENFDLGWITEGLVALLDAIDLQRVIRNFTLIASRIQG